jgi:hypothetical protein
MVLKEQPPACALIPVTSAVFYCLLVLPCLGVLLGLEDSSPGVSTVFWRFVLS